MAFFDIFRKTKSENLKEEQTESKSEDYIANVATAKEFAEENGLEYRSKVTNLEVLPKVETINQFYAPENRYILVYPPNSGKPTCPFEWIGKFEPKEEVIIDNQQSFIEIENYSEILIAIVNLYRKYIERDEILDWRGFAIKLEGEVTPNFKGKASLVITDDVISNDKAKKGYEYECKKYLINEFLDHYLGWNFGWHIEKNQLLEEKILKYNTLVIKKGMRNDAGPGFRVWSSPEVKHYKIPKEL